MENDEIMKLSDVVTLLQDRRLHHVADTADLNYRTVQHIALGKNQNPSYKTMLKLTKYFNEQRKYLLPHKD